MDYVKTKFSIPEVEEKVCEEFVTDFAVYPSDNNQDSPNLSQKQEVHIVNNYW